MDQDEKDIRDQIRENLKKKNPNLDPNNIKIYQLDNKSLARAFAGIFFFSLFLTFLLASNQRNENELSFQDFKTNYLERGLVTKLTVVNKFAVEAQLIQGAVSDQTFQTFSGHPAVVFTIGSVEFLEEEMSNIQESLGIPIDERLPISYEERGSWMNYILPNFAYRFINWWFMVYDCKKSVFPRWCRCWWARWYFQFLDKVESQIINQEAYYSKLNLRMLLDVRNPKKKLWKL